MESVRQWAHGKTTVRGCLVLAFENAPVRNVFLARMETVATRESTRILGLRSRSSKRRFERRSGSRRVSMNKSGKGFGIWTQRVLKNKSNRSRKRNGTSSGGPSPI